MKYLQYEVYYIIDRIPSGKQKHARFLQKKKNLIERIGYKIGRAGKAKGERRKGC